MGMDQVTVGRLGFKKGLNTFKKGQDGGKRR